MTSSLSFEKRMDSRTRQRCHIRLRSSHRRGAIAVLAAVMMVMVLAMVAFAVDLGYIAVARTETQRTADAAAHAAVIEFARTGDARQARDRAHALSSTYSSANPVLGQVAAVAADVDVRVGRYEFGSGQADLSFGNPRTYNAVKVRIRRTDEQNGSVRTFFAGVLGHTEQAVESEATAALIRNVSGFKIPPSGEHVPMLPVTLSYHSWNWNVRHGRGSDHWAYDSASQTVTRGSDKVREVVLFPTSTGSSGNLGTINIGVSNNSTGYIGWQIRHGLSQSDLDYHGGSLQLDHRGQLELSGKPGLSASLQKDFQAIIGQVRIIPIYKDVGGSGDNATYKIVQFVAVRVMSSRLSGHTKQITVQPASLTYNGVIQGSSPKSSNGIYSSPRIVN